MRATDVSDNPLRVVGSVKIQSDTAGRLPAAPAREEHAGGRLAAQAG